MSTATTPTSTVSTPPPSTIASTSYPTNTAENTGNAFCFSSDSGNYVSFTQDDAKDVVSSFCANDYVLQPGNTFGFNEGYSASGYTVLASATWADDQLGCNAEADFDFNANSNNCLDGWSTDYFCEDETGTGSQPSSYGGAYVLNSKSGCILISLYASADLAASRRMLQRSMMRQGLGDR